MAPYFPCCPNLPCCPACHVPALACVLSQFPHLPPTPVAHPSLSRSRIKTGKLEGMRTVLPDDWSLWRDSVGHNVLASVSKLIAVCWNAEEMDELGVSDDVRGVLGRIVENDYAMDSNQVGTVYELWCSVKRAANSSKAATSSSIIFGWSDDYFLDNLDRLCSRDYEVCSEDVWRVRGRTCGISEQSLYVYGSVFRVYDVGGSRGERMVSGTGQGDARRTARHTPPTHAPLAALVIGGLQLCVSGHLCSHRPPPPPCSHARVGCAPRSDRALAPPLRPTHPSSPP